MYEDEEEDKVVKIELPKYQVLYTDLASEKIYKVIERIFTFKISSLFH